MLLRAECAEHYLLLKCEECGFDVREDVVNCVFF